VGVFVCGEERRACAFAFRRVLLLLERTCDKLNVKLS